MIVSFSVANFRSFSTEETFSLAASSRISGAHETHAVPIPNSKEKVLQAAVVYGANGAGKSNLFKALRFVKSSALRPRPKGASTGREPFAFSENNQELSSFDLQFIAAGKLYRFGFKLNDIRITEEWLVQVTGTREKIIYERTTDSEGSVKIEAPGLKGKRLSALATVGGPQNQTFLATINATLDEESFGTELSAVLRWIKVDLVLIAPTESFRALGHHFSEDVGFLEFAGSYLRASSTGVDRLDVEKKEITEDELNRLLPKERVTKLLDDLNTSENQTALLKLGEGNELVFEKTPENHYYQITIKAIHEHQKGQSTPLALTQESDGTRRLLNLLPALHHLRNSNAVYFIDEIDRSMHPILVWKFLEFFLKSCTGGQRQIIVTTHESNLLDLALLRRDEIWFAEKDVSGSTHLHSLTDFNVRKDLEVRKHYLQGRFGAIPYLGNIDGLLESEGSCQ
ncbi:AAA family ATPase [Collimonas sp.]|jgi:AAA15 family ATPase/GTPase|uniref:AAA family ATPase n=1 Tax=Collimonas sp. TaxID=1963772 RepID=UPI002D0B7E97|nr:AAA family ATPase [Collimonas sp.]HWX02440.1 AAA family ATPase [Collimonas sp.]